MKNARVKMLREDKQHIKEELVLKEGEFYISKNKLRVEIIQLYYNVPVEIDGRQ